MKKSFFALVVLMLVSGCAASKSPDPFNGWNVIGDTRLGVSGGAGVILVAQPTSGTGGGGVVASLGGRLMLWEQAGLNVEFNGGLEGTNEHIILAGQVGVVVELEPGQRIINLLPNLAGAWFINPKNNNISLFFLGAAPGLEFHLPFQIKFSVQGMLGWGCTAGGSKNETFCGYQLGILSGLAYLGPE